MLNSEMKSSLTFTWLHLSTYYEQFLLAVSFSNLPRQLAD